MENAHASWSAGPLNASVEHTGRSTVPAAGWEHHCSRNPEVAGFRIALARIRKDFPLRHNGAGGRGGGWHFTQMMLKSSPLRLFPEVWASRWIDSSISERKAAFPVSAASLLSDSRGNKADRVGFSADAFPSASEAQERPARRNQELRQEGPGPPRKLPLNMHPDISQTSVRAVANTALRTHREQTSPRPFPAAHA